jgi:ABC-type bacteriocin/lantibiotic exporter with double-glycine peptidase domain
MVAEGVPPLEAATRAGYKYPHRELKRQVATVAEANGKSPLEVLEAVAKYGAPADVVSACAALLAQDDQPVIDAKRGTTIFVMYVREAERVAA